MTCAGCPVRQQCLDDALADEIGDRVTFGVRGGLLASERVELVRRRAVGVVAVEVDEVFTEVYAAAM